MDTNRRADAIQRETPTREATPTAGGPQRDRSGQALTVVRRLYAEGRLAAAVDVGRTALPRRRPASEDARLRYALAQAEFFAGDTEAAVQTLAPLLGGRTTTERVTVAAHELTVLAVSVHDRATALRPGRVAPGTTDEPAMATGGASGPAPSVVATALAALRHRDGGDTASALRLARASTDAAGPDTPLAVRLFAALTLVDLMAAAGATGAAFAVLATIEPVVRPRAVESLWCAVARADLLTRFGRHPEATISTDDALRGAINLGAEPLVPPVAAVRARLALRAGDLLTAARLLDGQRPLSAATLPPFSRPDWYRVLFIAARDGARAAVTAIDELDRATLEWAFLQDPGAAATAVRLARAVGDAASVRRTIAVVDALADRNRHHPVVTAALHAGAVADADPAGLVRSAGAHTDPWAVASAAADLATVTIADRARLDAAATGFDAIGATYDAARVRALLRATGARPVTRQMPDDGALTSVERTIAYLVSRGMTNRQIAGRIFLSPHTVNYHLRGIFRKLGIGARTQLARFAAVELDRPFAGHSGGSP